MKARDHPKDEELVKLDHLQLINASARYELLSANQQLLDFHLSRIMNRKYRNKKTLQNTGKKSHKDHLIVCEDFENESEEDKLTDNSNLYRSK